MTTPDDPVLWAAHHALRAVPGGSCVHDAVTRCLLDWVGCARAGERTEAATSVLAAARTLGGGPCTAVGAAGSVSAFAAALVNATASHALDFDDADMVFVGHPGVVVIPAVLAVCEERGLPWSAFDEAVAVGYQLAALLGLAAQPAHQERGWHATATLGTLVAAGAAASAVRRDPGFVADAMRLAATQAAGVVGVFGTAAKAFQVGRAAAAGVLSVALAEAGLPVAPSAVTGPSGYAVASTGGWRTPEPADLPLAVTVPTVKVHAACRSTHCAIDAVHRLRAGGIGPEQIATLHVAVAPRSFQAAGSPEPTTAYAAKFSIRHTVALAAHHRALDERVFVDGVWNAAEVLALRARTSVAVDATLALPDEPARLTVATTDGEQRVLRVAAPVGSPTHPLSSAQLVAKVERLLAGTPGARAPEVLAAVTGRPAGDRVSGARLLG